jgi:hypothetical protein
MVIAGLCHRSRSLSLEHSRLFTSRNIGSILHTRLSWQRRAAEAHRAPEALLYPIGRLIDVTGALSGQQFTTRRERLLVASRSRKRQAPVREILRIILVRHRPYIHVAPFKLIMLYTTKIGLRRQEPARIYIPCLRACQGLVRVEPCRHRRTIATILRS